MSQLSVVAKMWSRATRITLAASCLLLAAYVVIWQLSGTWSSVNEAPFADGAVHRAQKQHESVVSAAALPPPLENKAAGGGDVDIDQSYWLASVPRKGFDLYHRKYVRSVIFHVPYVTTACGCRTIAMNSKRRRNS